MILRRGRALIRVRRRAIHVALTLVVAFATGTIETFCAEEATPPSVESLETALSELRSVVASVAKLRKKVVEAWPTRDRDLAPPLAVTALEEEIDLLVERKRLLVLRIETVTSATAELYWLSPRSTPQLKPLLRAFTEESSFAFLDALLPVLVKIGRHNTTVAGFLL